MKPLETTWEITSRTSEAWESICTSLQSATVNIDVENFIVSDFHSGEIGQRLLEILKVKAKENVAVRLLVDAVGSSDFVSGTIQAELEEVGIKVQVFKTLPTKRIRKVTNLFLRDHRKLVIVDHTVAFIGGVCFQECQNNWRDLLVKVTGGILPDLEESFEDMFFCHVAGRPKPAHTTTDSFTVLPSVPRSRKIYHEILRAVKSAKVNITIISPYFAPPTKLLLALLRARRRGVAITLLFSGRTDNYFGDLVLRSYLSLLLRNSLKIYFYGDSVVHAKAVTIDDQWATVGSANFDRLSMLYNNELNILSSNTLFVADLNNELEKIRNTSRELSKAEWKKRGLGEKLMEVLVRPLRLIS